MTVEAVVEEAAVEADAAEVPDTGLEVGVITEDADALEAEREAVFYKDPSSVSPIWRTFQVLRLTTAEVATTDPVGVPFSTVKKEAATSCKPVPVTYDETLRN